MPDRRQWIAAAIGGLFVWIVIAGVVLVALSGCELAARREGIARFGQSAAQVADAETDRVDGDIYQPSFRILDVCCGKVRLIVQDPTTRHYRVVGP